MTLLALSVASLTAGSITISATDNVRLSVPPVPGSLVGTHSPTASGPSDLSQPLILTVSSSLNTPVGPPPGGYMLDPESAAFTTIPSAPMSDYYLFPDISINFSPDGLTGDATVTAGQITWPPQHSNVGPEDELALFVDIQGTDSADFTLNTTSNTMSLNVGPHDFGQVWLLGYYFKAGDPSPFLTTIDYTFTNGLVTASSNSLGLALPGVGANASFALSSVGPFAGTYTPVSTADDPNMQTLNYLNAEAQFSTAAPEPSTLIMLGLSFAGFAVLRRLRVISPSESPNR